MKAQVERVPQWVLMYVGFLALLSLSTSVMGYLMPERIFLGTTADWSAIGAVTSFYATRNVGIFALCVFGLVTRDAKVLLSMLVLRTVVEALDLWFTVRYAIGDVHPVVLTLGWFVIFLGPEIAVVITLYRQTFAGAAASATEA